jgi:DNA-directed RNA polymerase specialized sigma24 family protein
VTQNPAAPPTPAEAFDALYARCAPTLVQQAYLLTADRALARESVERAFELAWRRWPEVARDRDPGGWVRAATHEYALSPWHRFRRRRRRAEELPAEPAGRPLLLDALLELPPPYRRTLLLHDGVGLGVRAIAEETEATTSAAANRLRYAHEAVARRMPRTGRPEELHGRLTALAATQRLNVATPPAVRGTGERRDRLWARAAITLVVVLTGATTLALRVAPDHYEPPVAPGAAVQGVPPHTARGPLSHRERALRAKLRRHLADGPERLLPDTR